MSETLAEELWVAVYEGNVDKVKSLLDQGADPSHSLYWSEKWTGERHGAWSRGVPPLLAACASGNLVIVKMLVQAGADVNKGEGPNTTPVYYACLKGHKEVLRYLVKEAQCHTDVVTTTKETLLHLACRGGHKDIVQFLLEEVKCDVDVQDIEGKSPLIHASWQGNKDIVKLLVEKGGCDVGLTDESGRTALSWALMYDHSELVDYLSSLINPPQLSALNNAPGSSESTDDNSPSTESTHQHYVQDLEAGLQGEVVHITLNKSSSLFGFYYSYPEQPGELFQITAIEPGGLAECDGQFCEADVFVRVNGFSVLACTLERFQLLLQNIPLNSNAFFEMRRGYPMGEAIVVFTAGKRKYMKMLDKLMKDTENTILLYYLKMYFIGSSGIGKSTTRQRLTGAITNVSSLPDHDELGKRCSTFLAEFKQVLAIMDVSKSKLTLKASDSLDEEMQALFAYVYHSLPLSFDSTSDPVFPESLLVDKPEPTPSTEKAEAVVTEATPQPVSDVKKNEQVTIDVDQVIARFRSIVGSGDYAEKLMNKILFNLVDLGGQPGFLEMLPFLSKGPGMFLTFFRLDKDLDELCEVSYEREGDKITPYPAIYTIRETLSQILSAISHHVTLDTAVDKELLRKVGDLASVKPVATLVGTFKDKLETKVKTKTLIEKLSSEFPQASKCEKEEVVKQALAGQVSSEHCRSAAKINSEMVMAADQLLASDGFKKGVKVQVDQMLKEINKAISTVSYNFKDLLFHPAEDQHFIALDNFTGDEADIDPLREHLQKMFDSFFNNAKLRIRPSQLLLGVILRKEYDIISVDDCIKIGEALEMTKEEVEFSLWYLDRFVGALIYHPEIEDKDGWFEQNIICSPQVVFDSISSLIVEPLLELHCPEGSSRGFTEAEKQNWKEKGQFSLDVVIRCMSVKNQDRLMQGELIPVRKLVIFLEDSNLLSRIIVKKKQGQNEIEETKYFIPAILECASPKELTKPPPPDADTPSPIKIIFEIGYVPTGLFCALISKLVTEGGKSILGVKWELVEFGVKRNLVTFYIDEAKHLVTLVAHVNCFEIRFIRQNRSISLHDLCSYVLSAVLYIMKEINENIDPIVAFDCKCGKQQSSRHPHLCQLSSGMITCFNCNQRQVSLTADQEHWFAKEVPLGDDVIFDALPFAGHDPTLSFKWMKSGKNELSCKKELIVEKVAQAHCKGFYTCEVSKNNKPCFNVHYCIKATGVTATSDDDDQLFDNLRKETKEIRADWYSLAIELNIDYGTRKAIESDYRFVDVCFHAILRHWVKNTSPPLTWTGLVNALKSPPIDRGDVAEEIEGLITCDPTDDHTMTTPSPLPDPDSPLSVDKHLKLIRNGTWGVRSTWYDLGVELGVDLETLKVIKVGVTNHCYTSLLEHWLTRSDPPPTLSALKQALQSRAVGRSDVASTLLYTSCN